MSIIFLLFRLYELAIVARVILSWIQISPRNPAVVWLDRITEPTLGPVRRLIQAERMGFDISPLIVLFLLEMIQRLLLQSFL